MHRQSGSSLIADESCRSGGSDAAGSMNFDSSHASTDGENDAVVNHQTSKENEKKHIETMAREETNHLRAWRFILLIAMLTASAAVTAGAFLYLKKQERDGALESVSPTVLSCYMIASNCLISPPHSSM
jgi:ABC-type nickel/cobalt efflux system permease component RcnA